MKWNPMKINDSNEKCGMQGEINMWNFVLTEEVQILVSSWKKGNANFWQEMKWDTLYRKVTFAKHCQK